MVFGQSGPTCSSEWEPQLASCSLSRHFKGTEFVVTDSEGSSPEANASFLVWFGSVFCFFFFFSFLNLSMMGKKAIMYTARVHNTVLKPVLGVCEGGGLSWNPFPLRVLTPTLV